MQYNFIDNLKITCNIQIVNEIIPRGLHLPKAGKETFFLWGPCRTGKSTLLKKTYPDALWIDLRKPGVYGRYMVHPECLRDAVVRANPGFVVIDEIQKVPSLLDEVHWIHENMNVRFALCGSGERKTRKSNAGLLDGRWGRYELFGFSAGELGKQFDLVRILNNGYFPLVYSRLRPKRLLYSYILQYLKEEIVEDGLARRLPAFSKFLNAASLFDCKTVNYFTIARDTGVSSETIRGYFEVLCGSLLAKFLPPYRRRPKRRIAASPKFYFTDVGIVNFLAKRGKFGLGCGFFGKAFENWIFHELCAYNSYREACAEIYFWRLRIGIEVDFLINHIDCAIDVNASVRVSNDHLEGLRQLLIDHPEVKKRILVCLDKKDRTTRDNIEIINYQTFIKKLWRGDLF